MFPGRTRQEGQGKVLPGRPLPGLSEGAGCRVSLDNTISQNKFFPLEKPEALGTQLSWSVPSGQSCIANCYRHHLSFIKFKHLKLTSISPLEPLGL